MSLEKIADLDKDSPLSLLVEEPELHHLIGTLKTVSQQGGADLGQATRLVFSRKMLERARSAFAQTILLGELRLHTLSRLLALEILGPDFESTRNVLQNGLMSRQFRCSQPLLRQKKEQMDEKKRRKGGDKKRRPGENSGAPGE